MQSFNHEGGGDVRKERASSCFLGNILDNRQGFLMNSLSITMHRGGHQWKVKATVATSNSRFSQP